MMLMTSLKPSTYSILNARDVRPPKSHVDILSKRNSWDPFIEMKFQTIFQLQTTFTTIIIPSKHAGSIKFDAKRLEKKLHFCLNAWHTGINWNFAILKHKRKEKMTFFSVRLILISSWAPKLVFSRVATRENTVLVFIRWNQDRSYYTEKVKYPLHRVL